MTFRGLDIAGARVLLSNDDGIRAPGLKVLEKAVKSIAREVWVAAPETEQSAASHSLTVRDPLRIRRLKPRRFAINGTPTDSVLLGVTKAMENNAPDIVLSGVNRGGNLGEDVTYSGTVAAAMEATLLGIPAIAFSQVARDGKPVRWRVCAEWLPKVIGKLSATTLPKNVLLNVNFPDVPADRVTGVEVCGLGRRKIGSGIVEAEDPRGEPYYWIGSQRNEDSHEKGTDLEAVGRGVIAVTPLCLDLTHAGTLKILKESLG